jgi:acyl carrier protein
MFEKLVEVISEGLGVDAEEISLETNFKDDLGADSLDLFQMVMALEDEYGIEISTEDLNSIETVGDVLNYLKDKGIEE